MDVDRAWRGKGIGRQLLAELIELARGAGYHKMVLAAIASNKAAITLYARADFSHVGIYREQGLLDGRWVDVAVMEKLL